MIAVGAGVARRVREAHWEFFILLQGEPRAATRTWEVLRGRLATDTELRQRMNVTGMSAPFDTPRGIAVMFRIRDGRLSALQVRLLVASIEKAAEPADELVLAWPTFDGGGIVEWFWQPPLDDDVVVLNTLVFPTYEPFGAAWRGAVPRAWRDAVLALWHARCRDATVSSWAWDTQVSTGADGLAEMLDFAPNRADLGVLFLAFTGAEDLVWMIRDDGSLLQVMVGSRHLTPDQADTVAGHMISFVGNLPGVGFAAMGLERTWGMVLSGWYAQFANSTTGAPKSVFVEAAVANGAYLLDNMWVQVVRRDSAVYERLHMPGAPVGEELVALRAGAAGEWWPPPLDAQGSSTALEEAERSFDGCLVPRESAWLGLEPDRARGE